MKLAFFTSIAIPVAVAASSAESDAAKHTFPLVQSLPKLFGAEQLVDVEAHCVGCQPDYCYIDKGGVADYDCYKKGFPKCCTREKGNCPNYNKPGCECNDRGGCDPDGEREKEAQSRCLYGGNECKSGEYCDVNEGKCLLAKASGQCKPIPDVCGNIYDPVCGCDGQTYNSECDANSKGVSVASKGQCEPGSSSCTYYGVEDDTCGRNSFCSIGDGSCMLSNPQQDGVCEEIPEMCNFGIDPVCGCDGVDYDNDCKARVAGVNVKSYGKCKPEISCTYYGVDDDTCRRNSFCSIGDGRCNSRVGKQEGVCEKILEMCTFEYDPVCGCDGVDYDNECKANSNGVNVRSYGKCERDIPCTYSVAGKDTCRGNTFCSIDNGRCNSNKQEGVCEKILEMCNFEYDPVCGCDGVEYPNECEAKSKGVNVHYYGKCEPEPEPEPSSCTYSAAGKDTCRGNTFCSIDNGRCNSNKLEGVCEEIPALCISEYDPVCGCNGEDYPNECEAKSKGVNVHYYGVCR